MGAVATVAAVVQPNSALHLTKPAVLQVNAKRYAAPYYLTEGVPLWHMTLFDLVT